VAGRHSTTRTSPTAPAATTTTLISLQPSTPPHPHSLPLPPHSQPQVVLGLLRLALAWLRLVGRAGERAASCWPASSRQATGDGTYGRTRARARADHCTLVNHRPPPSLLPPSLLALSSPLAPSAVDGSSNGSTAAAAGRVVLGWARREREGGRGCSKGLIVITTHVTARMHLLPSRIHAYLAMGGPGGVPAGGRRMALVGGGGQRQAPGGRQRCC